MTTEISVCPPVAGGQCEKPVTKKTSTKFFLVPDNPMDYSNSMNELVFEIIQEADGGLVAECLTESIFTQADTWDELRRNVKEAVNGYFFDQPRPTSIRLHLIRDEVLVPA